MTSSTVQVGATYPIADLGWLTRVLFAQGIQNCPKEGRRFLNINGEVRPGEIKAQWTGEKRLPKQGEWFLSGAAVEAYYAPNDLTTPYHIAKLVIVETITIANETISDLPAREQ